jgi:class 3 adenylate cyclase
LVEEADGFLAGAACNLDEKPWAGGHVVLTFLFTDVEGSAAMVQRLGGAYAGVLADHHRLIRPGLAAHGGEEVLTPGGDEAFAVFASPQACVDAAIGMPQALVPFVWPGWIFQLPAEGVQAAFRCGRWATGRC